MSDWWQFDREMEPEADAPARSEVVAAPEERCCLICGEPINPDRQAVPFSFCDEHAAEREQVIAALQRLEKEASAATLAVRELAEKHPRYMPYVGMNTMVHVEAVLELLRRTLVKHR